MSPPRERTRIGRRGRIDCADRTGGIDRTDRTGYADRIDNRPSDRRPDVAGVDDLRPTTSDP
ncbi:hypothetical protein ACFQPA_18460 [Halomarina halobia]|uniref:Uncharacterized protein n=1 Tax=Halomarina halobia TaxID=3033386 RepID=A0ABD6ACT4_9EURY|nr:hypothetical protein [Halomarina sp. PSR21]